MSSFNAISCLASIVVAFALAACSVDDEPNDPNSEPPADDTPLTPELAAGHVIATQQIVVEPYRRGCLKWDYATCLVAAPVVGDDGYSYDPIWGFDHEWGHRYTLEVNIVELDPEDAGADGSVWNYELVELQDDQIDFDDEFVLPPYTFVLEPGASEGTLVDGTPVTCEPSLCEAISAAVDNPNAPVVSMRFGDTEPLPLVAVELLAGD